MRGVHQMLICEKSRPQRAETGCMLPLRGLVSERPFLTIAEGRLPKGIEPSYLGLSIQINFWHDHSSLAPLP